MGTIYAVDGDDLTAIANKIRTKGGTSALLSFPTGIEDAVDAIQTGITPTGTKNINTNGTHDVTNYASANVSVPNSYSASDEGKVVSNGALVSQTSDTVTQNGVVDTTLINSLTVNVSGQSVTLLASGSYTKTDYSTKPQTLEIPVSFTGTPTQVYVEEEAAVSGSRTSKWAWQIEQQSAMETGLGRKLAVCRLGTGSSYASSPTLLNDNTTLQCSAQSSSNTIRDNTYNWYIWGYAAT